MKLIAAPCVAAGILGLNIWICAHLFTVEYTDNLQSNEGNYIALSRFIRAHGIGHNWFAWWDAGMPQEDAYSPLLPSLVALLSSLTSLSPARSFHIVSAAFYCLGPVALFLLVYSLTQRLTKSACAGILHTLVSPVLAVAPLLRSDAGGLLVPRRLQNLLYYGESPHIASLTAVVLAGWFFHMALRTGRARFYILAASCAAAALLTNAFGGVSLVVLLVCLALAADGLKRQRALIVGLGLAGLTYCCITPLLPPAVLGLIWQNSPTSGGDFRYNLASWLLLIALATVITVLIVCLPKLPTEGLRFVVLFTAFYAGIVLPAVYLHISVLPQAHRYQLELDMGLALCIALGIDYWRVRSRTFGFLMFPLIFVSLIQAAHDREFADRLSRSIDINGTTESAVARWINDHLPERRTMVSGGLAYWFDVFTDNPQLSGGHEPTAPNWMQQVAVYTIYTGKNAGRLDAEISTLWLQAFGCHAIVVPGSASHQAWKPFVDPNKFENVLPLLWKQDDVSIYAVPQKSPSLAHVIPASAVVRRRPNHGLDVDGIRTYVQAINDPALPEVETKWSGPNTVALQTSVGPGQVISMQMSYAPGWHARRAGKLQSVSHDQLGFILVEPTFPGQCDIVLTYERTVGYYLCIALSMLSVLFGAGLLFGFRKFKNLIGAEYLLQPFKVF